MSTKNATLVSSSDSVIVNASKDSVKDNILTKMIDVIVLNAIGPRKLVELVASTFPGTSLQTVASVWDAGLENGTFHIGKGRIAELGPAKERFTVALRNPNAVHTSKREQITRANAQDPMRLAAAQALKARGFKVGTV